MNKFKPGDVVYDPLIPEHKGVALGYTGSGKHVDILMKNFRGHEYMICSYPETDIMATGEKVDVSELVMWFE